MRQVICRWLYFAYQVNLSRLWERVNFFKNILNGLLSTGWAGDETQGASGVAGVASMSETLPVPSSPSYLDKRRRLSELLNRLAEVAEHINNNNSYHPPQQWLMLDRSLATEAPPDVPLDLSRKSSQPQTSSTHSAPYICNTCGQAFEQKDRLTKHVASRHRGRTPESARAYECEVCFRRFARSDMLTRHARLHTGVKPYPCTACGQVFSRSDHLATHRRTHTGEKPYSCDSCHYTACRRDMITRHMKTHRNSKGMV